MARLSPEEGFSILKDRVSNAVGGMFPIVGKKHSLELKEVSIKDDLSIDDLRSQKKAKINGRTWAVPVEAKVALKNVTTGKTVDEQTMRLFNLPKTTRRYSQIVDGQEYQVDNQWRLKSGVYARIKDDGELQSAFNLAKGRGFSIGFDPKERGFNIKYGTSHIPLQPLLQEMGVPKEEIEQKWGKQITQANSQDSEKAMMKFFKASTGGKAENLEQARAHLKKTFGESEMLPEVNKLTLGKPYNKVTGAALMDASHKLLQISQGKAEPDSRDALMFKELHSVEDFVAERLQKGTGAVTRRIQNTLDKKGKVRDIIGPDIFNRPVREMYRTTLANIPEQTNPLEMISGQMKTTITGEGGIKSAHGITEDAKLVDPSHLGFLDPIHTPEGDTTGVTLRLPVGVQKKGYDVGVTMFNLKTGKNEVVNPEKAMGADVVLPDQVKWVDGKPQALNKSVKMSTVGNDIKEDSLKNAKYVMRDPVQMFSMSTNLVPFLAADHPLRSTMAGRQMEQAISLKDREAPLVQSLAGNKTFEDVMGVYAGHTAPVAGKVVKITNEGIKVKDAKGKIHEQQIYDHFPLNSDKAFMHSTPTVKVGDTVKAKQSIADTNFTRKGQLALGTNLQTGYMPYKGYNFEDGVVISESAAKKLSSEHLYRKSVTTGKNHVLSKNKFQAYIPEAMTKVQADKLDDDGVMKPGTQVMPGDTLVAALREKTDRTEDKELAKIHKSLVRPYQDASIKWEQDQPGVVTEVVKRGKQTAVHVKTVEPMEIGDKLAGRHGNKGIVTRIIPDDEMPKTAKGPLQILLNPCYDDRTEFLTHRGWILGPELRDDDVFGTMNQKTLAIEFQSPEEVYRWPYCGKMYHLASQQLDMMVTPNHRQFVAPRIREALGTIDLTDPPPVFKLEEARDIIGKPRRYLKAGSWSGFDSGSIDIQAGTKGSTGQPGGGFSVPSLLWAEFMGWYLSEGSSYFNKANYGYLVEISQSLINQENRDDIASLLDEMGLNYTTQDSGFVLHHKGLYEKLIVLGGCNAKYIPREVLDLPQKHLSVFLDRFIRGDGSERWNPDTGHYGTLRCSTNSFQLAGGLQEVAMKLGLACNMKEDKRTEKYSDGHHYCLSLSPSRKAPWVNWSEEARKHQVEGWVDYDGIIYCAKVPNGTLVVRRNGIPVISGNTGVPGRTNLGQVLETAAGKIAEKTGKPYIIKNFKPNTDLHTQVVQDLKKHGLKDKETVFDPNGKRLGEVLVGPQHIIKLKHQVEKKMVARAGGPGYAYDRNMIPKGGGPHGAQALGALGLYSMLAHGAKANLREMQTVKSDASQGDEFWSALQAGEPLPAPRPTFAYKKFNSYLNALGVNVKKEGNNLSLVPFTDKQVEEMSNGVIKDGGKMVRAKDLKPEKGGLFDPTVTGGSEGTKWSHMKLPEPFPNPIFEKSIRSLTGLSSKDFTSLVGGTKALNPKTGKLTDDLDVGVTGGKAIGKMLKGIDVDKELATAKQRLSRPNLKGNLLDNANKKVKYLTALKKAGLSANDAYMMKNVPVLPPSMRPVSQLPNGDLNVDDVNNMYKGISLTAQKLKGVSPLLPEENKAELRSTLYDGLKSLSGLGGHANREFRGIIDVLAGKRPEPGTSGKVGSPKTGYFQNKLVQRKQDLSMRSTIIPEPSLGLDEVALPRKAATELYKPFIVKELRGMTGASPLKAQQMIREGGPTVRKALERVAEERPVLLKRDPVLHKHGIQAFKPRITGGKAMKIHPLVTSGFNADFDGDTMSAFVPVSTEAVDEARKMFPSRNLFNPATGDLMYKPTLESQLGLYGISQTGKKTNKKFNNIKEVESAHRKGEVELNDQIKVGGLNSTTGKFMVAGALPDKMRKPFLKSKGALDKKGQTRLLQELAAGHRNDYGGVVDKLKDLGNQWSTETAFSIGLDDIKPEKAARQAILARAERAIAASGTKGKQRDAKSIQEFDKATQEMHKKLNTLPENKSTLAIMHKSGIKPTMDTLRQIKMAPMLIANAKGETIPTPAKRSFSEGLDLADYWTSMSGARKGIIQKVQTVQEPGYISKMVMNSTMNNSILDDDCGTPAGINLPVDEKDVLDRYLALDVKAGKQTFKKGTLITPEVRSSMRNNKVRRIPVRTPLRCQHGPGICKKCYGLTEDGKEPDVGLNVGVISGQALGERATQLSMKAFHCNHADSIVFVREDDDYSILAPTLEDLFDMVDGEPIVEGEEEVKKVEGWQIWDGRWVSLTHVRRHKPDRPMMLVSDRHLVTICQDNHPIGVWRNNVVCEECGYHRFKDPHKSRRQYCAKCGHAQEAPDQKLGDAGFLSPAELEAGKYYLRRSTPNIVLSSGEHPTFDPYFVGMFLAEGCVVWKRSCKEQRAKRPYQIQISQQPGAVRDEILRRGAAYQLKEKPRYLAVDNVKMGQEFHDLFGRYARHKSLPCDFLDYSEEWLDDMLAGIIDGDGTILRTEDGPPAIAIDTTSFALAQQIVFICMYRDLRAGIVATSERPLTRHQGYQVRIGMTRAAMARLSSSLKVQKLLEEDYPSPEYESAEFNLVGAVREVLYTHKYVYDATTETGTLCVSGLKHHNTGGTASSKEGLVDEFQRVKDLLQFPKTLPGSATLSTVNGTVSKIQKDPAGGHNVFVKSGQGDVRHYIPQKRGSPMVGGKMLRKGARVKKGMAISKGPINPHEMLPLTGVEPVQGYLSDALHGIYGAHGIRRRNTEVVVKALTNLTQIEDPGDHGSFIRGDFAPTSLVANKNRQAKGRKLIVHRPVLKSVNVLPMDMQEDWMARMNHQKIKATVIDAAQQGWTSKTQGRHPIPPIVVGIGLGRSKPGEY